VIPYRNGERREEEERERDGGREEEGSVGPRITDLPQASLRTMGHDGTRWEGGRKGESEVGREGLAIDPRLIESASSRARIRAPVSPLAAV